MESKHNGIVGKIKPVREELKRCDHIVRIIVLLKRGLLQIEQGYCMGTEDNKHSGIKQSGNKASYPFGFLGNYHDYLKQLDKNSAKAVLLVNTYSPFV